MELRFKEFGFDIELTDEQWSSEWEDILKMSSPAPLSKPPDRLVRQVDPILASLAYLVSFLSFDMS